MILNQQHNLRFKTGLMDYENWYKIINDLFTRAVENFRIGCLFRQSINEFFIKYVCLLYNVILKQKCNIVKSEWFVASRYFESVLLYS